MKKKRGLLLFLIIFFQLAILSFMVLNSYTVILWGEKIVLQVIPVDPHSLFQGEYVMLGYEINQLDLTKIEHDLDPDKITHQERIYLALEPQNDTWIPVMVTKTKDKVKDKLYLQGRVLYMSPSPIDEKKEWTPDYQPTLTQLHAEWGIEQYFVPEGQGKQIEEQVQKGIIYAEVSVYRGKARVTGLINK